MPSTHFFLWFFIARLYLLGCEQVRSERKNTLTGTQALAQSNRNQHPSWACRAVHQLVHFIHDRAYGKNIATHESKQQIKTSKKEEKNYNFSVLKVSSVIFDASLRTRIYIIIHMRQFHCRQQTHDTETRVRTIRWQCEKDHVAHTLHTKRTFTAFAKLLA